MDNCISPEASSSISDYLTLPSPDYLTNLNTNNNEEENGDDDDNSTNEEEKEDEDEREGKEEEEEEKCEKEKKKEEVVWTSPVGTEAGSNINPRHPNPLNRARERRRARLQAELMRPPEGQECPKLIDRVRSVGQNEEISVVCFCGECD